MVKVAADEGQLIPSWIRAPGSIGSSVEEHMHSLKYEAFRFVRKADEPFHAEHIGAPCLQEVAEPLVKSALIQISDNIDATEETFPSCS